MSHPFLDREVIDLMRGHPPSPEEGDDVPKGILRQALQDLLPPTICARTRKVPFDAVYARGMQRHADELIDACKSTRHPLVTEMFDTEVLAEAVAEARLGAGDAIATARLNSALALLLWLEGLQNRGGRSKQSDYEVLEVQPNT